MSSHKEVLPPLPRCSFLGRGTVVKDKPRLEAVGCFTDSPPDSCSNKEFQLLNFLTSTSTFVGTNIYPAIVTTVLHHEMCTALFHTSSAWSPPCFYASDHVLSGQGSHYFAPSVAAVTSALRLCSLAFTSCLWPKCCCGVAQYGLQCWGSPQHKAGGKPVSEGREDRGHAYSVAVEGVACHFTLFLVSLPVDTWSGSFALLVHTVQPWKAVCVWCCRSLWHGAMGEPAAREVRVGCYLP